MINNFFYRKFPATSLRYRHFIKYGYEDEMLLVKRSLGEIGTAIDIGAHLGQWTYLLGKHFSEVIAFEPNPFLHEILRKSKIPNSRIENISLGNSSGFTKLKVPKIDGIFRPGNGTTVNFFPLPVSDIYSIDVPIKTLDSFALNDVGLIKIDTEGSEHIILLGALETIRRCKPTLIIEVHQNRTADFYAIKNLLAFYDYMPYEFREHTLVEICPNTVRSSENVIFSCGSDFYK